MRYIVAFSGCVSAERWINLATLRALSRSADYAPNFLPCLDFLGLDDRAGKHVYATAAGRNIFLFLFGVIGYIVVAGLELTKYGIPGGIRPNQKWSASRWGMLLDSQHKEESTGGGMAQCLTAIPMRASEL